MTKKLTQITEEFVGTHLEVFSRLTTIMNDHFPTQMTVHPSGLHYRLTVSYKVEIDVSSN